MREIIMLLAVILPLLAGLLIFLIPFPGIRSVWIFAETAVLLNSLLVLSLLFLRPEGTVTIFRFSGNLSVTLRMDGPGAVYGGLAAVLWPLVLLYAFEYMEREGKDRKLFYTFFVIAYGTTLGVALSENLLTLYFFFEMLSLVTLPLVLYTRSREAILASRTYLYYMIGGAAFAFLGMIFILTYGTTSSFVFGGVLDLARVMEKKDMLLLIYVLTFCGFSVKAAMWPFSFWLPRAGVAPTPVTALLHAVAVVNTGAFGAMRITYFSFGTDLVKGTWAQNVLLGTAAFTIVYGCSRAVKETHLKRRLAWSTVSNLSYILFGILLMSPAGLTGAMAHMIFHSCMKTCSFLCAGAVIHKTGKTYVHELKGMGRKMPTVFCCFTVSALALMGMPGLCGFVSKWTLAGAAVESGNPLAYAGMAALLISGLLTAVYMAGILVRAFFPGRDFDYCNVAGRDPGWKMLVPILASAAAMAVFGLHSGPLMKVLETVASASAG